MPISVKISARPGKIVLLFIFGCATATALRAGGRAAHEGQKTPARAWQTTIQLPTYLVGPEDPNPPFRLVNSGNVYPYPMLDDLTDHREAKTYRAVILENEYLRATILPDLGGRLYSLYDKKAGRDVFYHNHVVKYGLVGLRGAWISGGIEFNFPNGHTTDTVSPVSTWWRNYPDGSATVWVGDVDQVSEMYWQVALTLRPGEGRLAQEVTLFNPTPVENLYWYWNNAAVPASDDMRFIYPMREVTPNSRTEFWTYPVWKGVDYSRYSEIPTPTEIFGVDVHRDFFGAYDRGSDFGVAHVADYRDVPGKKLWSWGVAGDGIIWTRLLTDNDGPYNEIQSGRFETQLNREFLAPHRKESWTEYWYPVQGLDSGFVAASKYLAMNVVFLPAARGFGEIRVSLSPTQSIDGASLTVSVDGRRIDTLNKLSIHALTAKVFSIPVHNIETARAKTSLEVADGSGEILLHWATAEPIDGNSDFASKVGSSPDAEQQGVQATFLRGLRAEKEGRYEDADRLNDDLLRSDPGYVDALRKLAVRSYRAADYVLAERYIEQAERQDDSDPETLYLKGVIERARDQLSLAEDALSKSLRLGISRPQVLTQLGEIALARKHYARAQGIFRQALLESPNDPLLKCDLAAALRLGGVLHQAGRAADDAVNSSPLYPVGRAEVWRIAAARATAAQVRSARQAWRDTAGDRLQGYLEAASWYWSLKDWASSDFILQAALADLQPQSISPMVYYYLAANARHEGSTARAEKYAARARKASYQRVFPNRLSDLAVLEEAVLSDPADALAKYLLGDFLFQYGRFAEATALWQSSVDAGFHDAVLYRNLAIDAWRVNHNLPQAAALFRKAVDHDPEDYRLYVNLDEIYAEQGTEQMERRERLFSQAPPDVLNHDPARLRYVLVLIEEGQFEKALALLEGHNFKPWEQGDDPRALFVQANLEQGRRALAASDFKGAQESFARALQYPANLGIGKPDRGNDGAAIYWLGLTLDKQGDAQGAERAWKVIEDERNESDLSKYYGSLALRADGHPDEAEEKMRQLADAPAAGRTGPMNYYVAGLADLARRRLPQAMEDFHKALEVNPQFWQAQIELERMENPGTAASSP